MPKPLDTEFLAALGAGRNFDLDKEVPHSLLKGDEAIEAQMTGRDVTAIFINGERVTHGPTVRDAISRLNQRGAEIPLTAAEITEPGWYWWDGDGHWRVVEFDGAVVYTETIHAGNFPTTVGGHFIGPLRAPE
jgi:hypothetical protein